ncbi:MAG: hypothetical protein ACE5JL_06800 [Dehalococcoidia bacterium]
MPARGFSEVHADFVADTEALLQRFNQPIPNAGPYATTCPPVHDDAQSLLVVLLQNSWSTYSREILEVSAEAALPTLTWRQLQPSPMMSMYTGARQAVREAARIVADTMGYCDPVWHKPEFTIRVAAQLKVQNYEEIFYALSSTLTPSHVNWVRNYVVHPSDRTRAGYSKVAAAVGDPRADLGPLLRTQQVGGVTLFEKWVRELQATAEQAAG